MRVLERGWVSSNNVLLFDDDHSATLVDTGYVTHSEQTLAAGASRAARAGDLTRIINTHLHSDHCGGNALLSRELNATIMIPPGHAEAVDSLGRHGARLLRLRPDVRSVQFRQRVCGPASAR